MSNRIHQVNLIKQILKGFEESPNYYDKDYEFFNTPPICLILALEEMYGEYCWSIVDQNNYRCTVYIASGDLRLQAEIDAWFGSIKIRKVKTVETL